MVNSSVDPVSSNITPIRNEEEKAELSKLNKSDATSSGLESVASSSRKSSCDLSPPGNSDTSHAEDEDRLLNLTDTPAKASLFCSVPLIKIRSVLGYTSNKTEEADSLMKIKQISRKLLCLYCDRTFVSLNLRQKHVERCHSEKQSRRLSSRKLQSQFTTTACSHCDKLPVEHSLRQLFEHLISDHPQKYFGCLDCEERFLNQSLLNDHNAAIHLDSSQKRQKSLPFAKSHREIEKKEETEIKSNNEEEESETNQKLTRSMVKEKKPNLQTKPSSRQLRNKKISIKASKIGLKRSKRLQAAQTKVPVRRRRRAKPVEASKLEEATVKSTEKTKNSSVNPYPEFDNYYRVKKITDHSIDNLKISSLTFDDVFDKAFFSRIKCNIQENLLYHLDGKLFKNEESESRISNFEKNPPSQDVPSTSSENFGCDLSLNAITPVTSILTSNFGEDLESQIEYGAKPSKKKLQTRQDPVRHKYVTRRKYQASILEHKENRDLSKLDMWTQLVIKDRQQKVMNDQKSAKEMLEYTTCSEYKLKVQRNELNRILDRRGPFEDLKEEASKKAALDKLNFVSANEVSEECFKEVRSVMEELLNEVMRICSENEEESGILKLEERSSVLDKVSIPDLPEYLNLRRTSSIPSDEEIDKSDKIALICSSQETENYELPTNKVREKNEMVELSGEWARSRIYVCAACGLKLSNMKLLLEHKSLYHQNAWAQHYELVGNQSELYRHLCIPGLGKVGHVEDTVQCKFWRRSEARKCTKCGKVCNALAELHRHILECGGDWTWMLARKKCRYRPFGSRKKRRGLVKRSRERTNNQKTEQTVKKKYKKTFQGPRQRPSDADTIQRMLANLPPKRSSRKSICMKDGFQRNRKNKQNNKKQVMKCGKIVMKKSTYNSEKPKTKSRSNTLKNVSVNRTLRSINRTLSSKILDTSSKLRVKRQLIKNINRRSTRRSAMKSVETSSDNVVQSDLEEISVGNLKKSTNIGKLKRENNSNRVKNILKEKINIKNFFPVSKRKATKTISKNNSTSNSTQPEQSHDENKDTKTEMNKTTRSVVKELIKKSLNFRKKTKEITGSKKLEETTEPVVVIEKLPLDGKKSNQTSTSSSKLSNKRKLRSSFRKVIDRVKKLKLDNTSSSVTNEQSKNPNTKPLNSFLGQGTKEKEKLATVLVPLVEELKENPLSNPAFVQNAIDNNSPTEESLIPENIFNLEHNSEDLLQAKSPLETPTNDIKKNEAKNPFETVTTMGESETKTECKEDISNDIDKTEEIVQTVEAANPPPSVSSGNNIKEMSLLSIETSTKSDKSPLASPLSSPSMLSPRMKGKLRKPNRGLNDCIAMLTKKAFEETHKGDSSSDEAVIKLNTEKPVHDNKNVAHQFVREKECILKIPVFERESQKNIQNEVLDLSKPKRHLEAKFVGTKDDAIDLSTSKMMPLWNSVDRTIQDVVQNKSRELTDDSITFWHPINNAVKNVTPNNISEKAILKIPKIVETSWNSVDDIIQKVVENRCESHETEIFKTSVEVQKSLKVPVFDVSNSVDKIIEEVVNADIANCSIDHCDMIVSKVNKLVENINQPQIDDKVLNSSGKKKRQNLRENVDNSSSLHLERKLSSPTPIQIKALNIADQLNTPENSNDQKTMKNLEKDLIPYAGEIVKIPIAIETPGSSCSQIRDDTPTSKLDSQEDKFRKHNTGFIEEIAEVAVIQKSGKRIGQSRKRTRRRSAKVSSKIEDTQIKHLVETTEGKNDISPNVISENLVGIEQSSVQENEQVIVGGDIPSKELEIPNTPAQESEIHSVDNISLEESKKLDSELCCDGNTKEISSNILPSTLETPKTDVATTSEVDIASISGSVDSKSSKINSHPIIEEDEPVILEEKNVIVDGSRNSVSTDSEDELPLVILKAKSKVENLVSTPTVDSIHTEEKTVQTSLEDKLTSSAAQELKVDSNEKATFCLNGALKIGEGNVDKTPENVETTDIIPSLANESITELQKVTESDSHSINRYDEEIFLDVRVENSPSESNTSQQKKNSDRRRSPRKSTTVEVIHTSEGNDVKKIKSNRGRKPKNFVKTRLNFDTSEQIKVTKEEENIPGVTVEEVAKEVYEDIPGQLDEQVSASKENEVSSNIIQEDKFVIDQRNEASNELRADTLKNDTTPKAIPVPVLRVTKIKSKKKSRNKHESIKTKLILKLPKIILKEPVLKINSIKPVSEKLLENNEIKERIEEPSNIGLNMFEKPCSNDQKLEKSNESIVNFLEPIVKTGIKLKIKPLSKKKSSKHKKKNIRSITQGICESSNLGRDCANISNEKIENSTSVSIVENDESPILPSILEEIPTDTDTTEIKALLKNVSNDNEESVSQVAHFQDNTKIQSKLDIVEHLDRKIDFNKKKKTITSTLIPSPNIDLNETNPGNCSKIDEPSVVDAEIVENEDINTEMKENTDISHLIEPTLTSPILNNPLRLHASEDIDVSYKKKKKTKTKKSKTKNSKMFDGTDDSISSQAEIKSDVSILNSLEESKSSQEHNKSTSSISEEIDLYSNKIVDEFAENNIKPIPQIGSSEYVLSKEISKTFRNAGKRKSKLFIHEKERTENLQLGTFNFQDDSSISKECVHPEEDESSDTADTRAGKSQNSKKGEPLVQKPVRSLRSTVKITYKQSNIFALHIEDKEISDLKISEKDNLTVHMPTESIEMKIDAEEIIESDISAPNNDLEGISQECPTELNDLKNKEEGVKKDRRNNVVPDKDMTDILEASKLPEDEVKFAVVPFLNQSHDQDLEPELEHKEINKKSNKRNIKSKRNDNKSRRKNTMILNVEENTNKDCCSESESNTTFAVNNVKETKQIVDLPDFDASITPEITNSIELLKVIPSAVEDRDTTIGKLRKLNIQNKLSESDLNINSDLSIMNIGDVGQPENQLNFKELDDLSLADLQTLNNKNMLYAVDLESKYGCIDSTIDDGNFQISKKLTKTRKSTKSQIKKIISKPTVETKESKNNDRLVESLKETNSENNQDTQDPPHKVKDAFEFEDDLLPIEELSPKFKKKNSKDVSHVDKSYISKPTVKNSENDPPTSPSKKKVTDLEKVTPSIKGKKSNEIRLENPMLMKKQRTAKSKAIENINTLEKKYDESLDEEIVQSQISDDRDIDEEQAEESVKIISSKKKKNIKQKETLAVDDYSGKEVTRKSLGKIEEMKNSTEVQGFTPIRKSRASKCKALENIKVLDKKSDENLDEGIDTNDNSNNKIDIMVNSEKITESVSSFNCEDRNKLVHTHDQKYRKYEKLETINSEVIENTNKGDISETEAKSLIPSTPPRKSRLAKAKALQNIKVLEKKPGGNDDDDTSTTDDINESKVVEIIPKPEHNVEENSSSNVTDNEINEKDLSLTTTILKPTETFEPFDSTESVCSPEGEAENLLEDRIDGVVSVEQEMVKNLDKLDDEDFVEKHSFVTDKMKKRNNKIKESKFDENFGKNEIFGVATNYTKRSRQAKAKALENICTIEKTIDASSENENSSVQEINLDSNSKNDTSIEKSYDFETCYLKDFDTQQKVADDTSFLRKSRLAKSRAMENINDLKKKTDIVVLQSDINVENDSGKVEKSIKKTKHRRFENPDQSTQSCSKNSKQVDGKNPREESIIPFPKTKRKDKRNKTDISENIAINHEVDLKFSENNDKATDCYDIDKIDEDFNLDGSVDVFSVNKKKKKKEIKEKELQNDIKIFENDVISKEKAESKFDEIEKSQLTLEDSVSTRKSRVAKAKALEHIYDVSKCQETDIESEHEDSLDSSLEKTVVEISSILKGVKKEIEPKLKCNKKTEVSKNLNRNISDVTVDEHTEEKLIAKEIAIDEEDISLSTIRENEIIEEDSERQNETSAIDTKIQCIEESLSKKRNGEDIYEDERIRTEKSPKYDGEELNEPENKRRSRRACKVNTYNENDLAEAIFLQASAEKDKEKSKKKKLDENTVESGSKEKKLNSDELFDLLKATATENFNLPKPLEEPYSGDVPSDFTDDNFDDVFDDMLKKSQALFEGRSLNVVLKKPDDICRSDDSSNTSKSADNVFNTILKSKNTASEEGLTFDQNDATKSEEPTNSEPLYCDICKKSFKRLDNLTKHQTTLTHISKLSEIEAKQAEDRVNEVIPENEDSFKSNLMEDGKNKKTVGTDSLYSYPNTPGNDALKIAEIITNAFEKPPSISDRSFSEIVPPVTEYRRYKSLGERKSFESDQGSSNISETLDSNSYEPQISNNAGVILEKQITLLQNIIENRGLDYIDEISMSSYHSLETSNNRDSPVSVMSSKLEDSSNLVFPQNTSSTPAQKDKSEGFLKPPQIEDISEDSVNTVNLRNAEEVRARKVLNRDEELFLECCSLLKSGSEVSNFSKKSNRTSVLNNIHMRMLEEPDMFESKNLIDKVAEESSDYSRMATPLGDSFGDTSNSNTISSNWGVDKEDVDNGERNYFSFEKGDQYVNEGKEGSSNSSKFKNMVTKAIKMPFKNVSKMVKNRKRPPSEIPVQDEEKDLTSDSSSKMPTKGALKVFEGLKVSIPTEELNLEEVLMNSPPIKKTELNTIEETPSDNQFLSPKTPRSARKSKPVKNKQQFDGRFIFKVKKKSAHKDGDKTKLGSPSENTEKITDVYDFEETQDNTDIFAKPDFKAFRTKGTEDLRNENIFENNYEGQTLSSSSSSSVSVSKKPKTNECITKKKHMIMGRIFKNALKPKTGEDIRDIPAMDHNELVESYVLSCTPKADEEFKKPKMSEEEMNYLFDKLLDQPEEPSKKQNSQNKLESKHSGMKKKLKMKCKKRQRSNSDSTDDEFGLNKIVKKRPNRKNAKEEDNSINLEQELKECIGVASRKSQRKCTSGKQNVLVEYWSSDESAFEAFLENHLQELSAKSEIPSPKSEDICQKEQKIEKLDPVRRISTVKEPSDEKETKTKSKPKISGTSMKKKSTKEITSTDSSEPSAQTNRRKRSAAHPLYHWSSSSEDEMQDLIEVKSIRDDPEDEYNEDRPIQHGWIVGDSPKKLVTMLAQAKGKKTESELFVKEQGKKKNSNS